MDIPTSGADDQRPAAAKARFHPFRQIIIALLLVASSIALAKALTENIVVTKFANVREITENIYGPSDFEADNPDAEKDAYDKLLDTIDWGFNQIIGLSDRVAANYRTLTTAQGYTVGEGAKQLWKAGDYTPAALIIGFSILFPILKTLLMLGVFGRQLAVRPTPGRAPPGARVLKMLNATHKYTMLDVFVIAIMVFAFSDQKLVSVTPAIAVYWYIAYMVASYAALWGLEYAAPKARMVQQGDRADGRSGPNQPAS